MRKHAVIAFTLLLCCTTTLLAQLVGERWTGRRGDNNPGVLYNTLARLANGRLIAAGSDGSLMVSDDGGLSWNFRLLKVANEPTRLAITSVAEFTLAASGSKRVVAIGSELVDSETPPPGDDPLFGESRTTLFISDDGGETWTKKPFPFTSEMFGARSFPGVDLTGLFVSPAGELLAYGTTTTSNIVFTWRFGGLIYRSKDGENWTLAKFAFGPIELMTKSDIGRITAVGASTVLDSADGSGWNGYLLREASVQLENGDFLDSATRDRLRFLDVAVQGGTHVAHVVTYVPYDALVDTSTVARRFVMRSASPFGSRLWTAKEFPPLFDPGVFQATSSGLLGFNDGLNVSNDLGATWTVRDASVKVSTRTIAQDGGTVTAVGSSAGVWKSTNNGLNWSQIFTQPTADDLYPVGTFGGQIFAFGSGSFSRQGVYVSADNGLTWAQRNASVQGYEIVQLGNRLVMSTSSTNLVRVSDDAGVTWSNRSTGAKAGVDSGPMAVSKTGRIILSAEGLDLPTGKFWVSDDAGETWSSRDATTQFDEVPSAICVTASGRILVTTNTFATFNPRILRSDDNGDTWTSDISLQTLPGLDPISNQADRRVLTAFSIQQNPDTGRLLMLGEDEILTSDDDGESWVVRVNFDTPFTPPNLFWAIPCVTYSDGRWVGIHTRRDGAFSSTTLHYSFVSADDGVTWKQERLPLNIFNTFLQRATTGLNGRVIVTGSNGAVYTSDPPLPVRPGPAPLTVREGQTLAVRVPRPPIGGAVTAQYRTQDGTAQGGRDYTATVGSISWTELELGPKTISLPTIDNGLQDGTRKLTMSLAMEGDGVGGALDTAITILDDDGTATAGIQFQGDDQLYTSEGGDQATLLVALNRKPTANVTLTITGLNALEGLVSTTILTFTPDNWNLQQSVIFTGVDDTISDGDATYRVAFTAASTDTAYDKLEAAVFVTNLDDDVAQPVSHRYVGQAQSIDLAAYGNVTGVAKLPPGMKWDKRNKAIVGKPGKAGAFTPKITVTDPQNGKTVFALSLNIEALPAHFIGTFAATMEASELNGNLGGTLALTTSATGSFTGSVFLGKTKYAFKGALTQAPGTAPKIEAEIKLKKSTTVLKLTLRPGSDNSLTGTVATPAISTSLRGWRNTWSKKNPVAATLTGQVNAFFEVKSAWLNDAGVPQGIGYAMVSVAPTGAVKWVGKLADGEAFSGTTPLGPQRDLMLQQVLYKGGGNFQLRGTLATNKILTGNATWARAASTAAKARTYAAGFGLDNRGAVGVTITGGPWTPPAKKQTLAALLALKSQEPNIALRFTGASLAGSAINPNVDATISATGKFVTPADPNNPADVDFKLNPKTGALTGSFTLGDPNPEKPDATLKRTVKYSGLYVPAQGRARGFFLLPDLASPPDSTGKTSKIVSGIVTMTKL